MTVEETLKRFESFEPFCDDASEACDNDCEKCGEMNDVIIDALQKQVPKKPITDKNYCKCPSGHNIPVICKNGKMRYCPMCGQKIDWSEEDD